MTWFLTLVGGIAIGAATAWPFAYRSGYLAADAELPACDQPCTAQHCATHLPYQEPAPDWADPKWRRQRWTVLETLDRAASTWAAPAIAWLTGLERHRNIWDWPETAEDRMLWPTGEYATVERTADKHLQPSIDWDTFLAELSAVSLRAVEGR